MGLVGQGYGDGGAAGECSRWLWKEKGYTDMGLGQVRSYANQDPVVGQFKPLLGIDAWEHAY